MDSYFEHKEQEKAKARKLLISLHKKAATRLSKLKLKNISVDSRILFSPFEYKVKLDFTVFDKDHDNASFSLYDFDRIERIETGLDKFIDLIKCDRLEEIKPVLSDSRHKFFED